MPTLALRPATAAEVPAVLAFWHMAAKDAHRPTDTTLAVQTLIARDPDALILAVDRDELIGTVVAGWDGWRCHLYRLAVSPERRGQGIGGVLIGAAEERFRRLGGTRAEAMVLDENDLAHRFWRAHGYIPQAEWSRWVKPLPLGLTAGEPAGCTAAISTVDHDVVVPPIGQLNAERLMIDRGDEGCGRAGGSTGHSTRSRNQSHSSPQSVSVSAYPVHSGR